MLLVLDTHINEKGFLVNAVVTREMNVILKLFQCFISHVNTSETEMKLFQLLEEVLKLFQQQWTCWKIFTSCNNSFEIISGKFPRAEIKLFQTDVSTKAEIILFHM